MLHLCQSNFDDEKYWWQKDKLNPIAMIDESENDKKLKITLIRLSTQSLDDRRNKKKVENIAENKLKNIDKTV